MHEQALRLDILSSEAGTDAGSGGGGSGELTNLLAVDAQSVLELMVFSACGVSILSLVLSFCIYIYLWVGVGRCTGKPWH